MDFRLFFVWNSVNSFIWGEEPGSITGGKEEQRELLDEKPALMERNRDLPRVH